MLYSRVSRRQERGKGKLPGVFYAYFACPEPEIRPPPTSSPQDEGKDSLVRTVLINEKMMIGQYRNV